MNAHAVWLCGTHNNNMFFKNLQVIVSNVLGHQNTSCGAPLGMSSIGLQFVKTLFSW